MENWKHFLFPTFLGNAVIDLFFKYIYIYMKQTNKLFYMQIMFDIFYFANYFIKKLFFLKNIVSQCLPLLFHIMLFVSYKVVICEVKFNMNFFFHLNVK